MKKSFLKLLELCPFFVFFAVGTPVFASNVVSCPNCSTSVAFEGQAMGEAYMIVQNMPQGVYYPHIYVVNFNSAVLKKFEVRAEVISTSGGDPFLTIPEVNTEINQELIPSSELLQDMQKVPAVIEELNDIAARLSVWFDWWGAGDSVYDFLGNNQEYNRMEREFTDYMRNNASWWSFHHTWQSTLMFALVDFLSPIEPVVRVEFENGGYLEFKLTPTFTSVDGDPYGFEFQFREAFDKDGNEAFEDPEIYVGDTFVTDIGNIGPGTPSASNFPVTAYLGWIGFEVNVVDFRGGGNCFAKMTTTCIRNPDGSKECRSEIHCNP